MSQVCSAVTHTMSSEAGSRRIDDMHGHATFSKTLLASATADHTVSHRSQTKCIDHFHAHLSAIPRMSRDGIMEQLFPMVMISHWRSRFPLQLSLKSSHCFYTAQAVQNHTEEGTSQIHFWISPVWFWTTDPLL